MKIEFPCPEKVSNMIPVVGGYNCSTCDKKVSVIDSNAQSVDPNGCYLIESSDSSVLNLKYSIRKFALASMLVFGAGIFSFADAQVENALDNINKNVVLIKKTNKSIGLLSIYVENGQGHFLNADVKVFLPNGKEVLVESNDNFEFIYEVPLFCKGKELEVAVSYRGRVKTSYVTVEELAETNEVFFRYSGKRYDHRRFISIGCPSF